MNPDHFGVRVEAQRLVVAIAGIAKLGEIAEGLRQTGALPLGPSAWLCRTDIPVEDLARAVGELSQDEVVYLAAQGGERLDLRVFAAPNTEGGIRVSGGS